MAHICPTCKESHQVMHLPAYWASLAPGAPLVADLAQPPAAEVEMWWAVATGVVGLIVIISGVIAPGLLLLVGGMVWGAVLRRRIDAADAARAAWERSMWCGHCGAKFVP
jgi:hypothetical protein